MLHNDDFEFMMNMDFLDLLSYNSIVKKVIDSNYFSSLTDEDQNNFRVWVELSDKAITDRSSTERD